ncbi:hypothetical protein BDV95DRAFT_576059 [Massariosphaeria phaeospora]|uniref:Uncharacterized protein n=1 Tax=Massariosphaeria phaeospora TaxID=100035 RepID=A0A7C8I379_9PLEO|nr:hypothetical protein BDV95DRAFT_576059 [Massariosphaeria phaeospora]
MDKDPIYCARFLQLFLVAGQTYLQPPDIIDLVIRSKLQRRPPYPELHFPKSTQCYLRPHHNSVRFHAGISLNNSGPYNATRLHQAITLRSIHILRLFERSTITQTARSPAPAYARRVPTGSLYCVNECLDEYLKQRVHSLYMRRGEGLLEVTDIFDKHWPIVRWMIWWWANSEDKARMKMERWREAPR